jgi:hypothetical protein
VKAYVIVQSDGPRGAEEVFMLRARGIYDGSSVVLSDPLPLPPNSKVEVLILQQDVDAEQVYWQQLIVRGLVQQVRPGLEKEEPFSPVHVTGSPVSQTIIEGRR